MRAVVRLLALAATLAGCSGQPLLVGLSPGAFKPTTTVVRSPDSQGPTLPVPPPPEVVQVLKLAAPAGRGRVTLTKSLRYVPGAVTSYTVAGSARVTDMVGAWTFTYVPVALRDRDLGIDTLHGLGIHLQSTLGVGFEIDWAESAMVGPDDRVRRLIRRSDLTPGAPGERARTQVAAFAALTDWVLPADEGLFDRESAAPNAHAFFERLPPGQRVSLALTLRRGDVKAVKQFAFQTLPLRAEAPPRPRALTTWVGESFIVLPGPPSRDERPYDALRPRDHAPRTRAELARAVLKVTAVAYDRLDPVVTLVRESPKEEYTARPVAGSIDGLAPLADLLDARSQWVGKTLWLAEPDLRTAGAGGAGAGTIAVKRFTAVQVVDVNLGATSAAPARFVVKAPGGRVGFRDVHMTGTNVPEPLRGRNAFAQVFLTDDPRGEHDWPEGVWTAIEDGRVLVGMTAEQARMSWGVPRLVERAVTGAGQEERWTYASRPGLVLVDGAVTRIDPR